ncbi:MAG: SRPBCC family protein [Hyphomicrobium sp.]
MRSKTLAASNTSDREIIMSRLINAPRELVWKAWSDPAHLTHWWGPRGFSTTTSEMSLKPGGTWRFVMHGPGGTDYKNKIVYSEVVKPERLTYLHTGEDENDDVKFNSTITFEDKGGKTEVTLRSLFETAAERDHVAEKYGAVEGGNQTLTRLSEYVLELADHGKPPMGRPFVNTRVCNAPRELVWKAWTEAGHLKHWWGPKGCKLEVLKLDLLPGGIFHYAMRYSTGAVMLGRFRYLEISPPERLVYRSSFADETGAIVPAPFPGNFPLEVENTVTFEEHAGKTTITLHSLPFNASEEERKFFEGMFASMEGGYGGTFDQLAEYLGSI